MTYELRKWGSAIIIENNELYCGKILKIKKGYRMSLQYHKLKDETLYVLTGQILLEYEVHNLPFSVVLHPGEKWRIRPMQVHRVTGLTDADIIEVSTHSEDSDSYHIEEGGKVPDASITDSV